LIVSGVLAFYRSDSSRGMRRALVRGATLVSAGALVMVVAFVTRQSSDVSMAASCLGVILIVAGTVAAVVGMQRLLANEACIVVRADGVSIEAEGREETIAWDDIESIRAGDGAIVVTRRDGSELAFSDRRFGGKDARTLSAELDGMRRKAGFGLLR
jgi:hypothetical protein